MIYLIVGLPAFVLGFLTALVTLHVLFRERKHSNQNPWNPKGGSGNV